METNSTEHSHVNTSDFSVIAANFLKIINLYRRKVILSGGTYHGIQTQLFDSLGLKRNAFYGIVNGKLDHSVEKARKLEVALGVTEGWCNVNHPDGEFEELPLIAKMSTTLAPATMDNFPAIAMIRRANFIACIVEAVDAASALNQPFSPKIKKEWGITKQQFSRLRVGSTTMSDQVAARIEVRLHKPVKWMSTAHSPETLHEQKLQTEFPLTNEQVFKAERAWRKTNLMCFYTQFRQEQLEAGFSYRGMPKAFFERYGLSKDLHWHLTSRRLGIRDHHATEFEKAFGKPAGWLSVNHELIVKSEQTIARTDFDLSKEERQEAMARRCRRFKEAYIEFILLRPLNPIAKSGRGLHQSFATHLGIPLYKILPYKNGEIEINEKLALQLEIRLGKPRGWLTDASCETIMIGDECAKVSAILDAFKTASVEKRGVIKRLLTIKRI